MKTKIILGIIAAFLIAVPATVSAQPMKGGVPAAISALEARVAALEEAGGGGGSCDLAPVLSAIDDLRIRIDDIAAAVYRTEAEMLTDHVEMDQVLAQILLCTCGRLPPVIE